MAPEQNGPEITPRRPARSSGGAAGIIQKFQDLPRPAQVVIGIALFGALYMLFSGGHGNNAQSGTPNQVSAQALNGSGPSSTQVFNGLDSDRPVLMQSWLEQSRRDMAGLKDTVEKRFQERDQALAQALEQNAEMQKESRQMMTDFTAEIKNLQSENDRNAAQMGQMQEEQKKIQLGEPVDGSTPGVQGAPSGRRDKINQTPLGSAGGGASVSGNKALLAPIVRPIAGGLNGVAGAVGLGTYASTDPLPFMPPLGFIRGTMLNGVDALVGGQATPSLVRLHGSYKTAMNTTVNLDGCLALVEFQGDVSTERAVGKPSRMTCVYPDMGAVTYSLSGYVVDSEDGIIGIPGIFYEGDASRIAAAMLADFAAGLSEAVQQNQQTTSVGAFGNTTNTLTGGQAKSEIAGGVGKATKSLRDYLLERVNRVLPFVRLDATRELNMVLLSGVELRHEGNPWTLLFDGEAADQARNAALQNAATNPDAAATAANSTQPAAGNSNAAVLPPSQGAQ
jgi:hypothetical protein